MIAYCECGAQIKLVKTALDQCDTLQVVVRPCQECVDVEVNIAITEVEVNSYAPLQLH